MNNIYSLINERALIFFIVGSESVIFNIFKADNYFTYSGFFPFFKQRLLRNYCVGTHIGKNFFINSALTDLFTKA
jgi:hypothetical protein